jgi:transposase
LAVTADGHIVDGFLTGGNRHDAASAEELMQEIYGCHVIEDRGYDSNKNRSTLESQGNIIVIPGRKNRKVEIYYDKVLYKLRGLVERIFGKIKENRRLAVRYEKSDLHFLSMIACAFIKIYLC